MTRTSRLAPAFAAILVTACTSASRNVIKGDTTTGSQSSPATGNMGGGKGTTGAATSGTGTTGSAATGTGTTSPTGAATVDTTHRDSTQTPPK